MRPGAPGLALPYRYRTMISITCTSCKAVLTMDDAFAGGVCRCQHCGTIQTVPAKPRPQRPQPAQAAFQERVGAKPSPAGLNELAEAVASSGLARTGLKSQKPAPAATPVAPQDQRDRRKKLLPFLLIGAGALVVLLGILIVVLWPKGNAPAGPRPPGSVAEQGPSFCGVPLRANRVIYLLDRGNAVGDNFDALKHACYSSVEQLGPDRQFQVILWDNSDSDTAKVEYPRDALHNATSSELDRLRRDFQDVVATGASHLAGALREALDRKPDVIVIATAKPDLDDDDTSALHEAEGKGVRIETFLIGSDSPSPALQQAAQKTAGSFHPLSAPALRQY